MAERPMINSVSSTNVDPGTTLMVTTNRPVAEFSLVRVGTATHTVNTDQRRVPLNPATGATANQYEITLPADPGVLIAGTWMLFAIDSAGVPSVSKIISINL